MGWPEPQQPHQEPRKRRWPAIVAGVLAGLWGLGALMGGDEPEPTPRQTVEAPAVSPPVAPEAPAPLPTPPPQPSRCEAVPQVVVDAITSGLTVDGGGTLTGAQAVRSDDFQSVSFVSARLGGPGLPGTDVVTFVVNRLDGTVSTVLPVDAMADEFSDWGDAAAEDSPAEDLRESMHGADGHLESVACVGGS